MLHSLAARALLMVMDYGVSIYEAIAWLTRKMPAGLKKYYKNMLIGILGPYFNL